MPYHCTQLRLDKVWQPQKNVTNKLDAIRVVKFDIKMSL